MPLYAFETLGIRKIVDAFTLEDALEEAGLRRDDDYELIEEEDFESISFFTAVAG
jgi:hypothetical protein